MKDPNQNRNRRSAKKKLTGKQTALVVLCCVLALILLLMLLGIAYAESMFGLINREIDNKPMTPEEYANALQQWENEEKNPTAPTIHPDDVTWGEDAPLVENSDDVINILLIGQDRRPGEGRQRSDAIILCTLDTRTKSLTMTSFMRDLYVQIPGYQDNRINACYVFGGMDLLDNCLTTNFGVQIDGNVEVDFSGFKEIIDLMGGVDIELNGAEANNMNRNFGWALSAGMNHLNGEQALAYSRIRYVGNGDYERTSRQRTVITALINSCRGMSLPQLDSLARQILPSVTTDMSNSRIMSYVITIAPLLKDLKINSLRIPADGAYTANTIRGMSVLVPNLEANRQLLRDTFGD